MKNLGFLPILVKFIYKIGRLFQYFFQYKVDLIWILVINLLNQMDVNSKIKIILWLLINNKIFK